MCTTSNAINGTTCLNHFIWHGFWVSHAIINQMIKFLVHIDWTLNNICLFSKYANDAKYMFYRTMSLQSIPPQKKNQMQLPYLRINSSHARRRPNRKCVSNDALLKQHRVHQTAQVNVGGIDTDLCVTQPNTPFSTWCQQPSYIAIISSLIIHKTVINTLASAVRRRWRQCGKK